MNISKSKFDVISTPVIIYLITLGICQIFFLNVVGQTDNIWLFSIIFIPVMLIILGLVLDSAIVLRIALWLIILYCSVILFLVSVGIFSVLYDGLYDSDKELKDAGMMKILCGYSAYSIGFFSTIVNGFKAQKKLSS